MASSGFWQVYLSGHWKNFTPEENALIASAAKSNQNIVRLYTRGLGWYEIDIARGLQTNVKTKKTRSIRPPQATPVCVDAQALGLEVHRRVSAGGLQSPDDRLRWGVRDETRRIALRYHKACEKLVQADYWDDELAHHVLGSGAAPPVGLGEVLRKQVRLYVSTRSAGTCGEAGKNPRGRFDVLRVPCELDFDAAWTRTTATTTAAFAVCHAAALNIGESRNASDLLEYSEGGHLREAAYLQDMGLIWRCAFGAMMDPDAPRASAPAALDEAGESPAKWPRLAEVAPATRRHHCVMVPFGMGAFLRNLGLNDSRFRELGEMRRLRGALAQEMAKAAAEVFGGAGNAKLRLCLPTDSQEAVDNFNALATAFGANKEAGKYVVLYPDEDACAVAAHYASQDPAAMVVLLNAANAQLIGNHWFGSGARRAVDENLHRRSGLLGAIALSLNDGVSSRPRKRDELRDRLSRLGAMIVSEEDVARSSASSRGDASLRRGPKREKTPE
jgi:hypothetical protein